SHSQDRATQKNVFAPGEVRVKSGSDLEQTANASEEFDLSGRWFCDSRENFQQRRLSRSVVANDADELALFDLKVYVGQCPQRLPGVAISQFAEWRAENAAEHF